MVAMNLSQKSDSCLVPEFYRRFMRIMALFVIAAFFLTGCGTSGRRASDVAIETHGFYGPWGDKHMPLIVVDAGHGGFDWAPAITTAKKRI